MAFLEPVSLSRTFFVVVGLMYREALPRSLGDAREFAAVSHFAEADATNSEFLVDSMRTSAALATCISANLELWLTGSFYFERCLSH